MSEFYTKDLLRDFIAMYGWEIGEFSYGDPGVQLFGNDGRLVIGRYCSIGPLVHTLLGGNHRTEWVTTYPFNAIRPSAAHITGHPHSRGDVIIGNDVWIGLGALILSGVTIGDGSCIAANAVVSKDVPPYAIVGGNPARVLRRRFSDKQIADLLTIRWWDWCDDEVAQYYDLLQSGNIDAFIAKARRHGQAPEATSQPPGSREAAVR